MMPSMRRAQPLWRRGRWVPATMSAPSVRESRGGVLIDVVVTPRAARSEIRGVDPWRHALQASVAAPPERGHANEELLRMLAEHLRVPAASLRIVVGHASRRKTVAVVGLTKEAVLARLAPR